VYLNRRFVIGAVLAVGLCHCPPGLAFDWAIPTGVGVGAALEHVSYEEHPTSHTSRVVESGSRLALRATLDNLDRRGNGLVYRAEAKLYRGTEDFEGTLQNSIGVFLSTTKHTGHILEFNGGYRIDGEPGGYAFDALVGLGSESFSRDVSDGVTAGGIPAPGTTQDYSITYSKLSAAVSEKRGAWRGIFRSGIKLPFSIDEKVDLVRAGFANNVSLSPKESGSVFAELEYRTRPENKSLKWGFTVFYDSFRFNPSSPKIAIQGTTPVSITQLQTDIDVYGVQISLYY